MIGGEFMDYRNLYDGIEEQIKLPNGALITPINFDNGATTPPLKSVTKIISDNIKNYGPIARGVGFKGEYCNNPRFCRNKSSRRHHSRLHIPRRLHCLC